MSLSCDLISSAQFLLDSHQSISSLADAMRWHTSAACTVAQLLGEAEASEKQVQQMREQAQQLRAESARKSFLGRFFKTADEKAVAASLKLASSAAKSCAVIAEKLQLSMDETPGSEAELLEMLKELKVRKKALQLEKRELNAQMKGIRTDARQRSASAATSLTAMLAGSKYTAAERRSIRVAKERALAPHEDAKAELERALLSVDHNILWLESLR